jgi:hypothetical protein
MHAGAPHSRGLIRVEGRGPAWAAKITAEGTRLLKEQARRVEAERERERRAEEARAEREREAQRLRTRALEVLARPQISPISTDVPPSGKARCLLEPVLLYWLHERDA